MTGLAPAERESVYRASLKDDWGFPTVVVAGPTRKRGRMWLYVHDVTPTVLRLHPPVVRFLLDSLTELGDWFERPRNKRPAVVWTLPRSDDHPECVLVASGQRARLHVFAASPSMVRINERIVAFLLDALADLLVWGANQGHRWTGAAVDIQGERPQRIAGLAP